jgi:hypothetical protein
MIMKTLTTQIHGHIKPNSHSSRNFTGAIVASLHEVLLLSGTVIAALGLVLLFVWGAGFVAGNLLSASVWGLGFIFLGLAVDSRKTTAVLYVLSATALFVLAWLQTYLSADFIILTAMLLAAWFAYAVYRLLK